MSGYARWTPAAVVAVVLAFAVGAVLVVFAVGAVVALDSEHLTLSDSDVAFLTTTTGAIIGGLTTYLGVARGHALANGDDEPEPEPDSGSPEPA